VSGEERDEGAFFDMSGDEHQLPLSGEERDEGAFSGNSGDNIDKSGDAPQLPVSREKCDGLSAGLSLVK
jgi:hypothetical protein